MSGPVDAFVQVGAALLQLAAGLARTTRGTFTGDAAPVLATVTTFCEAARNGFRLLASDPGATDAQRMAAMAAATQFSAALGVIGTQFGTSGSIATLSALTSGSAQGGLATLFPAPTSPVTVTAAAQAALDSLRRDPLSFSIPATSAVKALMATAAGGIGIAA